MGPIDSAHIEFSTALNRDNVHEAIVSSIQSSGGKIKIDTTDGIVAGFGSQTKMRLLGAMLAGMRSFPRDVVIALFQMDDENTHVEITVNDTFGMGSRIGIGKKVQELMYGDALNLKSLFDDVDTSDVIHSQAKSTHESDSPNNVEFTVSAADELKKFAELRDTGVITEAEFEEKKRKLLE